MKWTFPLGRVAGIILNIHATFLVLIVWIAVASWMDTRSVGATVEGVAFVLALFGCVVVHEFAHALMAKRFGIGTHDILLLPIGGLSRLTRMPTVPSQEFWIAAAGPAASIGIAVVLALMATSTTRSWQLAELGTGKGPFLQRLALVNVGLAVFNLLPAFPMDGGRILRALLAIRLDRYRATEIAGTLGQSLAILLGLLGLFTNPLMALIALFVWLGATQERSAARIASAIQTITVAAVMRTDFSVLAPDDRLDAARDLTVRNLQHDFPVMDRGRIVGVLTRGDLLTGLRTLADARVADVMHRQFESADASDTLASVLDRLQGAPDTLPVISEGKLVGLVSRDNLLELLRLPAAGPHSTGHHGGRLEHSGKS
jgi:Zn-dependent protease/CBS domain-containing protein